MKIKAFGITRDIVGSREIEFEGAGQTVAGLREQLNAHYPALAKLRSLFIAVNNKYADEQMIVNNTDEVALIPPVSGG